MNEENRAKYKSSFVTHYRLCYFRDGNTVILLNVEKKRKIVILDHGRLLIQSISYFIDPASYDDALGR